MLCALVSVSLCRTHLDERDISASRQMARHSPNTDVDAIQWKSLHHVTCDSWLGTEFCVRGDCPSEKSLRMEWGKTFSGVSSAFIYSIRLTKTRKEEENELGCGCNIVKKSSFKSKKINTKYSIDSTTQKIIVSESYRGAIEKKIEFKVECIIRHAFLPGARVIVFCNMFWTNKWYNEDKFACERRLYGYLSLVLS